jgi:8-oxo-dGTP diphosphatase
MLAPQFGAPQPGLVYADRLAAFGLAFRDGLLAVVHVKKKGHPAWFDLPGGALEPGEGAAQAVVREFGEETGLVVSAGDAFAAADQRFQNTDGQAFNNRGVFFEIVVEGEDASRRIEPDHTLTWISPQEAVVRLRHEAHAWAVAAWLRR